MQNLKKVILLLVVLLPSIFFLSKAFSSNSASVENSKLIITGAGGVAIPLEKIQTIKEVEQLPELSGTGGFSLGFIKKGKFIRTSDQQTVRVIKNSDRYFLHLITEEEEVYFNLGSKADTERILEQLQ